MEVNGRKVTSDNKELSLETEKLSNTVRKRRSVFYGHFVRISPDTLVTTIFNHIDKHLRTHRN